MDHWLTEQTMDNNESMEYVYDPRNDTRDHETTRRVSLFVSFRVIRFAPFPGIVWLEVRKKYCVRRSAFRRCPTVKSSRPTAGLRTPVVK